VYIPVLHIYKLHLHVDVKLQLLGRCYWPLCDQTQGGHQKCPQNLEVAGAMHLLWALHKKKQIIISLLVGGGYPQCTYIYLLSNPFVLQFFEAFVSCE